MSKPTIEEMLDHHRGMTRLADMVNPCHICDAIRDLIEKVGKWQKILADDINTISIFEPLNPHMKILVEIRDFGKEGK